MDGVRYHLRFQVLPGKRAVEDSMILADFCEKNSIEEVVLFFAAEEWNVGLLSKIDEDRWFESIKTAGEILQERGIAVSLNPWMTVLHCSRGSTFPEEYNFKPMVSPSGQVSRACASLADEEWIGYISNLYGRFARLGFRVIWIEDDFRFHNHAPLLWGGGFEDAVCDKFSRKLGRAASREEIMRNILRPGTPHPWRSIWQETWREIQFKAAAAISNAVKENSPVDTILGLMSSSPFVHSVEGRRWHELFDALSAGGRVAHRPNFASYCETVTGNKVSSIMLLDIQNGLRVDNCEVSPEIENYPFTSWNKSDTSTWTDMALALFLGSDSLFLDLFPFLGNRADEELEVGELLSKSYGSLSWIYKNVPGKTGLTGVGIPWREDAAEKVHTEKGESLKELEVKTESAWNFILSYGIPCSSTAGRVNALFGNTAWIFSDAEIMNMLKGGVLLDGKSAKILGERGFGEYTGVAYRETLKRESSKYGVEVVKDEITGVREGFYLGVNTLPEISVFDPLEGVVRCTEIITRDNKDVGPGLTLFENSLNGRVAVFPGNDISLLSRNFQRQTILRNVIRFLHKSPLSFPVVYGSPYLLPLCLKSEKGLILVVLNAHADSAVPLIETPVEPGEAKILEPFKEPRKSSLVKKQIGQRASWMPDSEIPHSSFLVVEF